MSDSADDRKGGFYRNRAKRVLDVAGAAFLLLALSPLIAALAVAVRCALGRPVLFRQTRPGWHGRPFVCFKFRSMLPDADGRDGLPDAARLTPFGIFLRRTSLDELPELWNVLRGEMSLIGPRPILEGEVPAYGAGFAAYVTVRPGLTGPWRVADGAGFASRAAFDVQYVREWTPWTDARILVRSAIAVLGRSGAC